MSRLTSTILLLSLTAVCASLPGSLAASEVPAPPDLASRAAPPPDHQATPGSAQIRDLIEDGRYAEAETVGARLLQEVDASRGVESLQAADILDLLVEAQWRGGTAHRPVALERAERAVKIRKSAQGSENRDLARSLTRVGQACIAKADFPRAEKVCRQALAAAEKAPGIAPTIVAESLQCLGHVRDVKWDHAGAIALNERAVSVLEKALGASHPRVASALTELGDALRRATGYRASAEGLGQDQSIQERALSIQERALSLQERALRPAHPDIAQTLTHLGELLLDLGQRKEAQRRFERAIQIYEQSPGAESPRLAAALGGLAYARWPNGGDPGAVRLFERALAIEEKSFGSDHFALSVGLYNLASALHEMTSYARARPLLERALALDEKSLGAENPDVGWLLTSLGSLSLDTGDLPGAVAYLKRALALHEKLLGPEHPLVAWTLALLGQSTYGLTGSYARTRELYERALAIYKKSPGAESTDYGWVLILLARLVARTSRYEEARPLFSQGLAIHERSLGSDDLGVAWALVEVGWFHVMAGEPSQARTCFERALSIYVKADPNHLGAATSLHGLAVVHNAMADFTEARRLYERCLTIRENALGPDHPWVGDALGALGYLDLQLGDYAKARETFERALAIHERSLGPDHDSAGADLINLATTHGRMGHLDQAKLLFERGLAIREKAMGSDSYLIAGGLLVFGDVLLKAGDRAGAEQAFTRSLSIYEKTQGSEGSMTAHALASLAETLAWEGETGGAFKAALRAEEIGRRRLGLEARALAEREALGYASMRATGLGLALSIASSAPRQDSVSRAWDALVRSRSLVLDEMAARHHTVSEISRLGQMAGADITISEMTRLSSEVVHAGERLSRLMVRGSEGAPPEQHRRDLDQARRDEERAERALAEASGASGARQGRREAGLVEVMSALPRGSALLAYAKYDHFAAAEPGDARARASEQNASVPSYLALVLRRDRKRPEIARLGTAQEIEDQVAAWRSQIARGSIESGAPLAETDARVREAGDALRRRIWDPVAGLLRGAGRVFVVPDGALNVVNLGALPVAGGKYLIEEPLLIHYLSAERDLIPVREERRRGDGLLALGGPDFDEGSLLASLAAPKEKPVPSREQQNVKENQPEPVMEGVQTQVAAADLPRSRRSSCGLFESLRFEALPASEREVADIAALWRRPGAGSPGTGVAEPGGLRKAGTGVVCLTGARASEALFKEKAPGRRVLHLATHGFFLPGNCQPASQSARGIGGVDTPGRQKPASEPGRTEAEEPAASENPLLLSGLALAGANHRSEAGPDEEDGILTAEEIAALDLSGVEWAVLSACDTGIGEVKAGEGVLGLRRAFHVAGVRTQIMSLWPVEDEAAREWMTALYEGRLVRGLGTAEAVREASLAVLTGRRARGLSTSPVTWASFVATGDWR